MKLSATDALLIVDVQNDFLPGGSLAVPDSDQILDPVNRCIELFSRAGLPVYASRDYHPADHISFVDLGGDWPPHCVTGTHGVEFSSELKLPENAEIISKATRQDRDAYSALDGTGLQEKLKDAGITRVFVCGLATDYCVVASARDLLNAQIEVVVLIDGIRGVNVKPGDSDKALAELAELGAIKTTADQLEP